MNPLKSLKTGVLFLSLVLSLTACIKDEAPNQEADIVTAKVDGENLLIREPVITNNEVKFFVNGGHNVHRSSNLHRGRPASLQAEPCVTL